MIRTLRMIIGATLIAGCAVDFDAPDLDSWRPQRRTGVVCLAIAAGTDGQPCPDESAHALECLPADAPLVAWSEANPAKRICGFHYVPTEACC